MVLSSQTAISGSFAVSFLLLLVGTVSFIILANEENKEIGGKGPQDLPVETFKLYVPPLEELAKVLETDLKNVFSEVTVAVVDCPDLTLPPFNLAATGLSGNPAIADIGSESYLIPVPRKNKIYDFLNVAKSINYPGALMIGAGAAPFHQIATSAEFIANLKIAANFSIESQQSYIARINSTNENFELVQLPWSSDFAFMMNLFVSEGKPGKVLRVKAAKRTQETNFVSAMRQILIEHYDPRPVGLGGVFLLKSGTAKIHVQPDFSPVPLLDDELVQGWLKFFNMTAPLVCPGIFITRDPGLKLRMEHSHCFSQHGDGGHYHYDVTPDEVEYLGYYLPAEILYRVDMPEL